MTAQERLINTAKKEIGYLEKANNSRLEEKTANAGYNNWTKYADFLDKIGNIYNGKKNGYDWCDIFVDWCFINTFGTELAMKITNQPYGGCGAGTVFSAQYYKQINRYFKSNPQPGDQIFFKNASGICHTGIVTKFDGNTVYTIEGNTSGASGVVANGGGVQAKSYNKNYSGIDGYGRPLYELVPNEEGESEMTQDKFNEMFKVAMAEYRAELRDNDSEPWSKGGRDWAVSSGLIAGGDPLPNGQPNYMWEDFLTREQFAAVLQRFYNLIKK